MPGYASGGGSGGGTTIMADTLAAYPLTSERFGHGVRIDAAALVEQIHHPRRCSHGRSPVLVHPPGPLPGTWRRAPDRLPVAADHTARIDAHRADRPTVSPEPEWIRDHA